MTATSSNRRPARVLGRITGGDELAAQTAAHLGPALDRLSNTERARLLDEACAAWERTVEGVLPAGVTYCWRTGELVGPDGTTVDLDRLADRLDSPEVADRWEVAVRRLVEEADDQEAARGGPVTRDDLHAYMEQALADAAPHIRAGATMWEALEAAGYRDQMCWPGAEREYDEQRGDDCIGAPVLTVDDRRVHCAWCWAPDMSGTIEVRPESPPCLCGDPDPAHHCPAHTAGDTLEGTP